MALRPLCPNFRRRWILAALGLGLCGIPTAVYLWVSFSTEGQVHRMLADIPPVRAALLLGTAAYTREGSYNQFFANRIAAAAELFHSGKVERLIVSGDNRHPSYNEPREMRKALIRAGVPDSAIVMDFAGFRTLDSVVRAKKVFGQSSFVVISQRFHIERALFIANARGIRAVGFVADDPKRLGTMIRVQLREVLARGMTVLDCYVLGTEPHFLGRQEPV